MKLYYRLFLTIAIHVCICCSIAAANMIPRENVAVVLESETRACLDTEKKIISYLEEEMRLRGFMGRLRILDNNSIESNGEIIVKIKVTKKRWLTRKLLSIPYLLNRYRREYVIESFVEIPEGKNGMSVKRISSVSYTPTVTQYINNDRYDPDLFSNQTELQEIKENAAKGMAKKLADYLLSNVR